MATNIVRQTVFRLGEVDPDVYKRTDIEDYLTSAQSLTNLEVATKGLVRKRKGTRFLLDVTSVGASIPADPNSQLYEFLNNGVAYIIMSGNLVMNIFSINIMTGALTFLQTLVTPYPSAVLQELDYTLTDDSLVFAHQAYPPARIYISNPVGPVFTYAALNFQFYPGYDFGTVAYDNSGVLATLTYPTANTFQLILNGTLTPNFDSTWIFGEILTLGSNANGNYPIGYGLITGVNPTAGQVIFIGITLIPFATTPPTSGSQYLITQPVWNNPNQTTFGYPGKVLFYQNRLWFGNSPRQPSTIFGSKINNPINFDVGTGSDVDAIVYTIGQTDSGAIQWLNGGKQLEVFTQNYEYACPQQENLALTPSTFSIRQQSSFGSSDNVKPVIYLNDTYYLSRTGSAVMNYHFNGIGLTYQSANVSAVSEHLVNNPINRALLQGDNSSQDNFIYFLNQDFSMFAFQFAHEYKLAALTPVEFQESVNVLDITTINNTVYFLKHYTVNNTYSLEQFYQPTPTIQFFMDGYTDYTVNSDNTITVPVAFNGYTMQVIYQNQDYGEYFVQAGTIVLTQIIPAGATVQVGFIYDATLTPMYVFAGALQSNFFKDTTRIFIDYYNTLDFQVNGYQVPFQNFNNIMNNVSLAPQTGTYIFSPTSGWTQFQTFSITQHAPFDFQIVGIAYQIDAKLL